MGVKLWNSHLSKVGDKCSCLNRSRNRRVRLATRILAKVLFSIEFVIITCIRYSK